MTMRYAHMVTEHLHRAVGKIGTIPGTTGTVQREQSRTSYTLDMCKPSFYSMISIAYGGEGGIRTHGTHKRTTVFETDADKPAPEEADKDQTESDG
jgi:hypothetical protein